MYIYTIHTHTAAERSDLGDIERSSRHSSARPCIASCFSNRADRFSLHPTLMPNHGPITYKTVIAHLSSCCCCCYYYYHHHHCHYHYYIHAADDWRRCERFFLVESKGKDRETYRFNGIRMILDFSLSQSNEIMNNWNRIGTKLFKFR